MSDRLLKESDVLKAIDRRIEELSKDPVFIRKNGIIDIMGVKKYILAIQSADRPRGEWLETEERETYIDADWDADPIVPVKYRLPMCSICGKEFGTRAFDYNFCPNCGARMKGAEDEIFGSY